MARGSKEIQFTSYQDLLNREFMSKQKGYISWKQLVDGETWVDLLTWETMEDAKNVDEVSCANAHGL